MALKLLRDAESLAEFEQEANTLQTVNNKNVVHFFGIHTQGEKKYLVTEFMNLGSLKDAIARENIIMPELISMYIFPIFIFRAHDIASGMAYLHSIHIIHRDLALSIHFLFYSPCVGNVLVAKHGKYVAKVADFGLRYVILFLIY